MVVKESLLYEHQDEAVNTEFIVNAAFNMSLEKKTGVLIFGAICNHMSSVMLSMASMAEPTENETME